MLIPYTITGPAMGSEGSAAGGGVKRPERVAAVGVQRRRAVAKAHTGHRNRRTSWRLCRGSCPLLVST